MASKGSAATVFAVGNLALAVFLALSLLDDPLGLVRLDGCWRALWSGAAVVGVVGVVLGYLLGFRAHGRSRAR